MKDHGMIYLTDGQAAMVYRFAGEQPPSDLAEHHPVPSLPISERMQRAITVNPSGAKTFMKRCGYGDDGDEKTKMYPAKWVMAMMAKRS